MLQILAVSTHLRLFNWKQESTKQRCKRRQTIVCGGSSQWLKAMNRKRYFLIHEFLKIFRALKNFNNLQFLRLKFLDIFVLRNNVSEIIWNFLIKLKNQKNKLMFFQLLRGWKYPYNRNKKIIANFYDVILFFMVQRKIKLTSGTLFQIGQFEWVNAQNGHLRRTEILSVMSWRAHNIYFYIH